MFHKTVHKAWNFFNLLEQSLENSIENHISRLSVVHLKNSRTSIFTLWNNIFQTQTLFLQPIIVYTYIYNKTAMVDVIAIDSALAWCSSKKVLHSTYQKVTSFLLTHYFTIEPTSHILF